MYDLVVRDGLIVDGSGETGFFGDVAISGNTIAAVGPGLGKGKREIDATGLVITPGFVDIHTHYDGQATWDQEMAPSSWHGVTTVVMGNCGVGFAPAKPDRRDWLIGLMEGVEDIPGTALAEGLSWNWETFPEYLDELERLPRTVDVGTHVPHGAIRAYVLGDRERPGAEPATGDITAMADIVEEAVRAGALGFSTSRISLHRSIDGELVPGTTATEPELMALGRAVGRGGFGVFEMTSDFKREWNEFGWMGELTRETGLPITFSALQSVAKELTLPEQIAAMRAENDQGANIVAQIALRGNGIIMAWQGTMHPFMFKPAWQEIADLSWTEQLGRLRDPVMRSRILAQQSEIPDTNTLQFYRLVVDDWDLKYVMEDGFDYEPAPGDSIAQRAAVAGVDPAEYAYDMLLAEEGTGFIYFPVLNYMDGNLDFLEPLQRAKDTINSLSDGGAHCGTVCDAASTTFMLEHWVRDRKRGTVPLELAVKRQCRDTSLLYGLCDRGLIAPGYLADLNVIDLPRVKLGKPWLAFDLPAGGKRLLQKAEGYRWTIKSGAVTFENGRYLRVHPGTLIRGPQPAPLALAAHASV